MKPAPVPFSEDEARLTCRALLFYAQTFEDRRLAAKIFERLRPLVPRKPKSATR